MDRSEVTKGDCYRNLSRQASLRVGTGGPGPGSHVCGAERSLNVIKYRIGDEGLMKGFLGHGRTGSVCYRWVERSLSMHALTKKGRVRIQFLTYWEDSSRFSINEE
ncbi:hypothetical protein PM082_000696 [Marasmius tenuissimus]|nr:hypothetical protein PM082_000696 [Marasmius tenuissimus]